MIDGAHALGTIDLNLHDIGADYYVCNTHKWFCSAKGCGFLYVKYDLQDKIHPVNTTAYGLGFQSEFMNGTFLMRVFFSKDLFPGLIPRCFV